MKYASGVLNRICDRYLMEERQQDEDDWKEFMELFAATTVSESAVRKQAEYIKSQRTS